MLKHAAFRKTNTYKLHLHEFYMLSPISAFRRLFGCNHQLHEPRRAVIGFHINQEPCRTPISRRSYSTTILIGKSATVRLLSNLIIYPLPRVIIMKSSVSSGCASILQSQFSIAHIALIPCCLLSPYRNISGLNVENQGNCPFKVSEVFPYFCHLSWVIEVTAA